MTDNEVDQAIEKVSEFASSLSGTDKMTLDEALTFYEGVELDAKSMVDAIRVDTRVRDFGEGER